MRKSTTILAAAIALGLLVSGPTIAGVTPAVDDGVGVAADPGLDYEDHRCTAPSTAGALATGDVNVPATCDNGAYVLTGFYYGHGFSGLPYGSEGWTGRVESWLRHDGPDRGFQCTFDHGALVGCGGLGGSFPAFAAAFTHECLAYDSTGRLPIAQTKWGCRVYGSIERTG